MTSHFGTYSSPLSLLVQHRGVYLSVKRDDLLHPFVQGNKYRKLKHNLIMAKARGYRGLLSFAGAHSNHILAVAAAAHELGWPSIAIIRGDELAGRSERWSPTLHWAHNMGMGFDFVSRQEYRLRYDESYLAAVQKRYPDYYVLPEGGSNLPAVKGCAEIAEEIRQQCQAHNWPLASHVYCAVATGATLAGLIAGHDRHVEVSGIAVLKGLRTIEQDIQTWLNAGQWTHHARWQVLQDYHGGGYARALPPAMKTFYDGFHGRFGFHLDPVYTCKSFYAAFDALEKGKFQPGSHVVIIHSGGLQGRHAFEQDDCKTP